jgi:Mg2+-importing ATPase
MKLTTGSYYQYPEQSLLEQLETNPGGLSTDEADKRLRDFGPNRLEASRQNSKWKLLINQFRSPITILLCLSAILSAFLGEAADAIILLVIILTSSLLGFFQEHSANEAVKKLLAMVNIDTRVIRDGREISIPIEQTVPGDITLLSAGDLVPGDCRMLESKDLFANEAVLTGETFPTEKNCGDLPGEKRISERSNSLFMGTHIVSGQAKAVIVQTGKHAELGSISEHLRHLKPETEFEKGIRQFGYLLMEITLILVILIFAINIFLHKPVLDSFLFSLAIAVGITPQLLPAIISINLARGASQMALQKVIVKKLSAIENLGSMDVLCSDKTGTLTEGQIIFCKAIDVDKEDNEKAFRMAYQNAFFESGFHNPIDQAIRDHAQPDMTLYKKSDELPYDFSRKCLSVLLSGPDGNQIITKGAFESILNRCNRAEKKDGSLIPAGEAKKSLYEQFTNFSREGYRVLGIAYKPVATDFVKMNGEDESGLIFLGLLLFTDPPKTDVKQTLEAFQQLGIKLKIITGDNILVAEHVGRQVGIKDPVLISGEELRDMSAEALVRQVIITDIFAAVEPNQKERILIALKRAGHVVGFLGDGINDAPALHVADVGISVQGAVDVAKEAADIVLMGKDLSVLINGVKEGRKTFANTLKYIFMATSANFGNMFSMAGSSLFLSFLPLLPKQVLLTNLLTDIPEMTIATDSVDKTMIEKPRKMNLRFIKKFMIVFGIISSLFDYMTFALLLYWLHASEKEFRTGWLVESVISAALIVLIVRTSRAFYKSRPGKYLLAATLSVVIITIFLPLSPVAGLLGLTPLPLRYYAYLGIIIFLYMISAEFAKRVFYRNIHTPKTNHQGVGLTVDINQVLH